MTPVDLSGTAPPASPASEALCRSCAICCNGVLFKDVELQSADDGARLTVLGLPLATRRGKTCFPQPCVALDGCQCRVYADRPARCREFDCALLKAVQSGRLGSEAALRTVQTARQRADRVRKLLRALGETNERRPLSLRFKQTKRRVESGVIDGDTADLCGQLALAMHELNLLLRDAFYPGASE